MNESPAKGRASDGSPPLNRATIDGLRWSRSVLGPCPSDRLIPAEASKDNASRLMCFVVSGARKRCKRRELIANRIPFQSAAKAQRRAAPRERGGGRAGGGAGPTRGASRFKGNGRSPTGDRKSPAVTVRVAPAGAVACSAMGCRRSESLLVVEHPKRGQLVVCAQHLADLLGGDRR